MPGTTRLPKKAQALLAYLCLSRGRPIPRDSLSTLLWSDSVSDQARHSLRQALVVLRSALPGDKPLPLLADKDSVSLPSGGGWSCDVEQFENDAASAERARLERAHRAWRGEFLEGLTVAEAAFDDWVSLERQRLSGLRSDLLLRLAREYETDGDHVEAVAVARQLTIHDPLREEGHRLLIHLLAQSGQRALAARHYDALTAILRDELGIAPDSQSRRLMERVKSDQELEDDEVVVPSKGEPAPYASGLPDKPSVAILPFANLSGDPANDLLTVGLTDDITIALGREKWLFVVAGPRSTVSAQEADADPGAFADRLGVRYLLRGSMRRGGGRTRLAVVLTDARTGAFVTSHQLEDESDNLLAMTDKLAGYVVARIAPELRSHESQRVTRTTTSSLTAFELYLKALPLLRANLTSNCEALVLLERAIEIDPGFASAHALAARCYQFQKMMGWVPLDDASLGRGLAFAHAAAEIGQNDPEALWMAAHAMHFLAGETSRAEALIERALALNPNSANSWSSSCSVQTMLGQYDTAVEHFMMSRRLNPLDQSQHLHWNIVGLSYFGMERFEEAERAADRALSASPTYPQALRLKIAACGALGRPDEAAPYVARLSQAHTASSLTWLKGFWAAPMRNVPVLYRSFVEAARAGGMPE